MLRITFQYSLLRRILQKFNSAHLQLDAASSAWYYVEINPGILLRRVLDADTDASADAGFDGSSWVTMGLLVSSVSVV